MTTRHVDEAAAFRSGIAEGLDPQPAVGEIATDGRAVTHSSSTWYHRICTTCGNSFRRGDAVIRNAATGQLRHLDPALRCAVLDGDPELRADPDSAAFSAGLLAEFPAHGGVPVTRLAPDAWQVARPGDIRPPVCQGCGHTFRGRESVVICPCHPFEPGECRAAIHRDPGAGLLCWEQTAPAGRVEVCPWRLVRLSRVPPR